MLSSYSLLKSKRGSKMMKKSPIQTQEQIPPFLDRTDGVLAKQVLDGDQRAFELLIQRYNAPLFNFICRFLGDYDLACDVLQQVFLRFYTTLPKLGTKQPFKPWLFQVARNCCIDELRRKYRHAIHFSQLENSEGELIGLCDIPDPEPLPEEVAERRDVQALLQDAIESLPPKFRSVVILRYVSQMSFPEIGQVLAMPESTAKTYFHRAIALLRKTIIARLQPCS
jgi:RNA polymerase sigma-70 factor, ECF subfamily